MRRVEDEARERSLIACILHANQKATEFYERIGYQRVKEIDDYGLNLVIMRKEFEA